MLGNNPTSFERARYASDLALSFCFTFKLESAAMNKAIKYVSTVLCLVLPPAMWIGDIWRHKLTGGPLAVTVVIFVSGLFNVYKLRNEKASHPAADRM